MDIIYPIVMKIKNPVLKRFLYHILQMAFGFVLGLICGVVSTVFKKGGNGLDIQKLLIIAGSMSVGWLVLSLNWYGKAKELYDK